MITDEQIRELLREAGTAGDQEMHIIALIALEADSLFVLDVICSRIDDPDKRDELAGMLREQARAECARVIGDTLAMMGDG